MSKSIIVNVAEDGTIEIKTVGFKGSACDKASAAIEKALGTPGKRTRTPEYYHGNQQQQKVGQ